MQISFRARPESVPADVAMDTDAGAADDTTNITEPAAAASIP